MYKIVFKLILFFTIFSSPIVSKAQSRTLISVGAEIGLPSGNFTSLSGIGLGASIQVDLPVSKEFGIVLNGGLMNFFGKKNRLLNVPDLTFIPLKGGLRYQLSESFYAVALFGAAISVNDNQKNLFIWSPGVGNVFQLSNHMKFDLGIRYEAWVGESSNNALFKSTNSKGFVGLRLSLGF